MGCELANRICMQLLRKLWRVVGDDRIEINHPCIHQSPRQCSGAAVCIIRKSASHSLLLERLRFRDMDRGSRGAVGEVALTIPYRTQCIVKWCGRWM